MIVAHPAAIRKSGAWPGNPPRWEARYASLKACQYGRDYPIGGVNAKALANTVMWNREVAYPPAGEQFTLHPLQWVQHQLDTAASVEEVLASLRTVHPREDGIGLKVHYPSVMAQAMRSW